MRISPGQKVSLIAFGLVMSSLFLSSCSFIGGVFGIRSMYDRPDYGVSEKISDDLEIRRYEKRLVAEVSVPQAGKAGENQAFRILFDYISGNNEVSEKISMTVPVSSEETSNLGTESEKIKMTVPVESKENEADGVVMRFFFPESYTQENAPQPLDSRIEIKELNEDYIAALDKSGWKSRESLEEAKEQLIKKLQETQWEMTGKPSILYYDPPFTIPYFRKTEVVAEVEQE